MYGEGFTTRSALHTCPKCPSQSAGRPRGRRDAAWAADMDDAWRRAGRQDRMEAGREAGPHATCRFRKDQPACVSQSAG